MEPCPGSITVEYYDGSSDFESEESECPSGLERTASSSPCSSTKNRGESISCKTYDFTHAGSEDEPNDTASLSKYRGNTMKGKIAFSPSAREAMEDHYLITHQELMKSLIHPEASFPRCPKGDIPQQYGRRKHPGPFLMCSFSYSHECGDDFFKIPISTKPTPNFDTFTRPQHLKEKKAKFFKQCKHCETIAFTHHRNPASHYEDYLNNVTYKQHNEYTKVWQQHLVDLAFTLGEESLATLVEDDIVKQCQHYNPSESLVNAMQCIRSKQRRIPTVVTRKKAPVVRPLRRPTKTSSFTSTNEASERPSRTEQKQIDFNKSSMRKKSKEKINHSLGLRNQISTKSQEVKHVRQQALQQRERTSSNDVQNDGRKPSELHERLTASVTRLMISRQASSKISKRFVKKPEPLKEVKYIQKGRPNISAKFLRARSKNGVSYTSVKTRTANSARPREARKTSKISRKFRLVSTKTGRTTGRIQTHDKRNNLTDDSSEDGSYAQYRDKNGEFDVEKYRQSILKMLSKNMGTGEGGKKKKLKRSSKTRNANFIPLPKIKNVYRNVKPRITSNVTQAKRRKVRKPKNNTSFDDVYVSSNISLKSKHWNEDSLESKDSYFSIPSVHDL